MISAPIVEGFILAGGLSQRMGSPKALLEVAGRPIIGRVADALAAVAESVTIVTDRPEEVASLHLPALPDRHHGCGPLGGLQAALSAARTPSILLVACDLPFLTTDLLRLLVTLHGDHPVTVPSTGRIHPVCAVYDRSILPIVERRLSDGRWSMQDLLGETGMTVVHLPSAKPPIPASVLTNVNTPDDLAAARTLPG